MSTTLQMTQGHSSGTPDKQLNYQHTFHTKIQPLPRPKGEEVNNIARSRFNEANETKAHLSNPPKREEVNNIAKSQHRRSQRASKGHESDIGDRPVVSRSHTERKGNSFHICLPGQAWPTLPLMRYRVGMDVDDPTNDPRPLFRHTRTSNSVTNPPFTRKSNPSPHQKGRRCTI